MKHEHTFPSMAWLGKTKRNADLGSNVLVLWPTLTIVTVKNRPSDPDPSMPHSNWAMFKERGWCLKQKLHVCLKPRFSSVLGSSAVPLRPRSSSHSEQTQPAELISLNMKERKRGWGWERERMRESRPYESTDYSQTGCSLTVWGYSAVTGVTGVSIYATSSLISIKISTVLFTHLFCTNIR